MSVKLIYQVLFYTAVLAGATVHAQVPVYKNAKATVEDRVADLLNRMTVEEKVAQMRMFHANLGISLSANEKLELKDGLAERLQYGIGGIKNPGELIEPHKAAILNNQLQQYIISHNRLGIPALFVTEAYNGVDAEGTTRFGRPVLMAASFDTGLVHRVWDVIGREARSRGLHMCHSPEADLSRDPRFGRMSEAFGEDTYLTTKMIVASVTGVQGNYTGLASTHIGAVTKHFAGYGQVQGGKNFASVEISPRVFNDEILPPFEAAVKQARTLGIMASHGDINGVASHANPELLRGVLKKQWGFKGYVVSDANDIARLHFFMKVAETPEAAASMALKAGMDVDLYSDEAYAFLPKMVGDDPSLIQYIDEAAGRVLRTKFILGLFDQPFVDAGKTGSIHRSAESLALARQLDEEAIILLKNDTLDGKPVLPLAANKFEGKTIAVIGPALTPGAAAAFGKIGEGSIRFVVEKGFDLTNKDRNIPKLNADTADGINRLLAIARQSDAVILYLGGDEFTAKEGFFASAYGDRASIDPVGCQDALLRQIKALGKKVVVVLLHRRTLAVNEIGKHADAILDGWDLSEFGHEAVARVIFGMVNPSGKLPVTVPRTIGQMPVHYSQKEINYKKGYLFMDNGPLFPFGYGLSYAKFDYKSIGVSDSVVVPGKKITVSISVSNNSLLDGKEVVQLYIKDIIGSVVRPDKELKAFKKVMLKAGETKKIEFDISTDMLAFTKLDNSYGLEAGEYEVMVGTSSADGLKVKFKLKF